MKIVVLWRDGDGPTPIGRGPWLDQGSYWFDHRLYTLSSCCDWTEVCYLDHKRKIILWSVYINHSGLSSGLTYGDYPMALKYITAAVKSAQKQTEISSQGDPILWAGRPAIREFMTALEGPDGKGRRPSSLMLVACEMGVRVGLCDDDAEGWIWRESTSLGLALDAIEKALTSPKVQWSKKGGSGGKKR